MERICVDSMHLLIKSPFLFPFRLADNWKPSSPTNMHSRWEEDIFLSTFFLKFLKDYVSFSLNLYFEKETGTSRYLIQNPFNFKIKNYSLD